jgi:hypothetical protein
MIHRYALKFVSAVPQKEILKRYQDGKGFDEAKLKRLQLMKVRTELSCDPSDLQKIDQFLKQQSQLSPTAS